VTSNRQSNANRANAARSVGPRSAAGKARSRLNARRHGLAASLRLEPGADEEIERLARAIAGEEAGPELLGLARRVAEAEITLRRVFRAQMMLPDIPRRLARFKWVLSPNRKLLSAAIKRAYRRQEGAFERLIKISEKKGINLDAPDIIEAPLKRKARDLEGSALDRYERRAFSRRKSAIKAFDLAKYRG
jgi:hypothetical protein